MNCDRRGRTLTPITLVECTGATTSETAHRTLWLHVPDARLRFHLAVSGVPSGAFRGIRFNDDAQPDGGPRSRIQITPHVRGEENGDRLPAPLQPVFVDSSGVGDPQPLPCGYENSGGPRLYKIRVSVAFSNQFKFGTSAMEDDQTELGATGRCVASCTIEPVRDAFFAEHELEDLLALCSLRMDPLTPMTIGNWA